MKKILIAALLFSLTNTIKAQSPYVSVKEYGTTYFLNGIITKYALSNDSNFKWYHRNYKSYVVPMEIKNAFSDAKGKVQFIVFGGTWCEDTQFILPKFFKIQEEVGIADADISVFAVDRNKKTIGGIADVLKIVNVPTIIVMKYGKEVGRVVEYGKTGQWDKELAAFLN
ncbi:MAG: thioredoxin family protein [Ferruginibacter sp.]